MLTIGPGGQIDRVDWSVLTEHIQHMDTSPSPENTLTSNHSPDGESSPNRNTPELGTLIVGGEDGETNGATENIDVLEVSASTTATSTAASGMTVSVSLPESIPSDVEDLSGEMGDCITARTCAELNSNMEGGTNQLSYMMVLQGICGTEDDKPMSTTAANDGGPEAMPEFSPRPIPERQLPLGTGTNKVSPKKVCAQASDKHVGSAVQIVSVGDAGNDSFKFHTQEFSSILAKVPDNYKVGVLSVLGAFRTGKSFLMTWFLRYLEEHHGAKANKPRDGNRPPTWYERLGSLSQLNGSFHWRGGHERNTLGMWMWSEPFFITRRDSSKMAVLLVDTQGMNDNETAGGIQASIFGLSVLMSSYQIYNVNYQIQDDQLQQLAFFSEYGRVALGIVERKESTNTQASSTTDKPFQQVDFLVRNWQHFDLDIDEDEDISVVESQVKGYLDEVMAKNESRRQIFSYFQGISCFLLPHPGPAMTKKKFDGNLSRIDNSFLFWLNRYCETIFSSTDANLSCLQPKLVGGRELTAKDYAAYVEAYASTFQRFGAHFPEPQNILTAVSDAHNAHVVSDSVTKYCAEMDRSLAHHSAGCCLPRTLKRQHLEAKQSAINLFKKMATFGSKEKILQARRKVISEIELVYNGYWYTNRRRLIHRILEISGTVLGAVGAVALVALSGGRAARR